MNNIPWSYRLYRWTWKGLDVLFPPTCGGCGKLGWRWCSKCQARVPQIREPFCDKCGIPTLGEDLCGNCKSNPPTYQKMRSWAVFDSPLKSGLHTLKYRRNIGLGESLAMQMLDFVRSLCWPVEILVPVPLGKKRLKERGYNQVGLVARPLAYQMEWQYVPQALRKMRETRPQVGLMVLQRRENVRDAYEANPQAVRQRAILLMDDVATTGSTVQACTDALLAAGAKGVYVLTIARALFQHGLDRV